MKIAVIGYSGSGKSTLARMLAERYGVDVLHFDAVHFLPGWQIRDAEEKSRITREFLDTHDSWVIDGNYSKLFFDRRMEEADRIVMLLFNRFSCFGRAYRRSVEYKGKTRPDMGKGCNEKFDLEFAKWILKDGRTQQKVQGYKNMCRKYASKVVVISNQKDLDNFLKNF